MIRLIALLLATPAMAQDMPACGSRTALTSMLAEDFGEVGSAASQSGTSSGATGR